MFNNVSCKLITAGFNFWVNKHSSSKLAFNPRIFHCTKEPAIMFCSNQDFPTEIGAKLTWTPPHSYLPEQQTCYVSGLDHYNPFQISPQSLLCSSGGLGACWLGEVWVSKPHRRPPMLTRERRLTGMEWVRFLTSAVLKASARPLDLEAVLEGSARRADISGAARPAAD